MFARCYVQKVLFEIPLMYWSATLLRMFGAHNLMVMGMASYAFRVVVYTMLDEKHAWYILLVEPLHGRSYFLALSHLLISTVIAVSDDFAFRFLKNRCDFCTGPGCKGTRS